MNISILIVDDERVQREMLGAYLKKKGHTVRLASSGAEALEIVRDATVDIVISDQKMPGMSGIELAGQLRTDHPNVSVVVLTAYGTIGDAVQAMRDGVEDYLRSRGPGGTRGRHRQIVEKRQLSARNEWLREQVRSSRATPGMGMCETPCRR